MHKPLSDQMRDAYVDPLGTAHDPRHLLLLGAKEIDRLHAELLEASDDARHHEATSKYWEAKVVALEERLALCGK